MVRTWTWSCHYITIIASHQCRNNITVKTLTVIIDKSKLSPEPDANTMSRVMEDLLRALKTGSAFSRDQKRKRAARPAGAERRAQLNRSRSKGRVGQDNREIM